MTDDLSIVEQRRRAESFGSAAAAYDRWRPRYPESLIAALDVRSGCRALDVGAGTGIASVQLAHAGATVLAVEPDASMAAVARSKGIDVEVDSFERWDPAGRLFDLVTFAQSFHWVDPVSSLPRVIDVLAPRGRLALLWNRMSAVDPPQEAIESVHAEVRGHRHDPGGGESGERRVIELLSDTGFVVSVHSVRETVRYDADAYLEMVFTYSHQLVLDPDRRQRLRDRLRSVVDDGVTIVNDAIALIGTVAERPG